MVVIVYALLDRKLREFGQPIVSKNDETMRRDLLAFRGSGRPEEKYPDDFDLYKLAEFDTETGRITPADTPVLSGTLSEILSQ